MNWLCRFCRHEWQSVRWQRCPQCKDLRVWCLSGVWFKADCPPWSRVPDDVVRAALPSPAEVPF